jgi:hypothetical protein
VFGVNLKKKVKIIFETKILYHVKALVGIAFSLGFIMGPTAGAMFSKFFVDSSVFVYPAYLAILVTSINILFVAVFYKESLPIEKRVSSN